MIEIVHKQRWAQSPRTRRLVCTGQIVAQADLMTNRWRRVTCEACRGRVFPQRRKKTLAAIFVEPKEMMTPNE